MSGQPYRFEGPAHGIESKLKLINVNKRDIQQHLAQVAELRRRNKHLLLTAIQIAKNNNLEQIYHEQFEREQTILHEAEERVT